ncbi:hypothetical protein Tcan_01542, partial [Toxocara canis]
MSSFKVVLMTARSQFADKTINHQSLTIPAFRSKPMIVNVETAEVRNKPCLSESILRRLQCIREGKRNVPAQVLHVTKACFFHHFSTRNLSVPIHHSFQMNDCFKTDSPGWASLDGARLSTSSKLGCPAEDLHVVELFRSGSFGAVHESYKKSITHTYRSKIFLSTMNHSHFHCPCEIYG